MNRILICLFLVIWSQLSFSQGESELLQTLSTINSELSDIEQNLSKLKEIDQQALDIKIKLSDYILSLGKENESGAMSKAKIELVKFEADFKLWDSEASNIYERAQELSVSIAQIEDVVNKSNSKSVKRTYKKYVKQNKYQLEVVKSHREFIEQSKKDVESWKAVVQNKLNKSFNTDLFNWQGQRTIGELKRHPSELIQQTTDFITQSYSLRFKDYTEENIKDLVFYLFFSLLITFLILKGGDFLREYFLKEDHSHSEISRLRPILEMLFESKKTLANSVFSLLFLWSISSTNAIAINFFFGVAFAVGFVIAWNTLGKKLLILISEQIFENDNRPKVSVLVDLQVVVLIIIKTLKVSLTAEDIYITLIESILTFSISVRLVKNIYAMISEKDRSVKTFTFLSFIKYSTLLFAALVLVGSSLSLLGFLNGGVALLGFTLSNVGYITLGAFAYYVLNTKVESALEKRRTNLSRTNFLKFLKSSTPAVIVAIIFVLFFQSIYSTLFVFGDFFGATIFKVGEYRFTVDMPVKILFAVYVMRFLYLFVVYVIESFLLSVLKIEHKYFPNIVTVIRYSCILIFVSVLASLLGMTYKNIVILASALGVGIGFGLQNIVNNFVSGVILIFEQPIRVGDVIEVNEQLARVKHIGIRSVVVETLDNSSVIIPNSDILSNKLTNWTLTNNIVALKCSVGVAYGSDIDLVRKILLQCAYEEIDVLNDPEPNVWFEEFADSSLNFVLKCWVSKPFESNPIRSRLLTHIDAAFREHKISIPFPQRDVHIIKENSFS
ncbi:mechanosensitive ion channel family protein [Bacteriovorax sp. Seq25_V]|uniref:mechanosensitive ion channel family protein n=1 Tax=Bacteriovorax sp. Seq25_V TaxID=1201288 RepID=UPI00038A305D|nr:mechanosensitive ion channel domain-containing protein [Bacteriovorax sp. Seq25_V]EQC43757.1 transporter, small conductance mechanosensitive ion channel MscS family protein [Bacteriovorax sp. Seq25_V]